MFTNKKREGVNTCVCAVSLYVAETNKVSIEVHETTLPIIPFSIVALSLLDNLSRNSCISYSVSDINQSSFTRNTILGHESPPFHVE